MLTYTLGAGRPFCSFDDRRLLLVAIGGSISIASGSSSAIIGASDGFANDASSSALAALRIAAVKERAGSSNGAVS